MKRFLKVWLFSALLSFTAVGMWNGIEWYYSRGIEEELPIIITADELISAYLDNEDDADDEYQGKYVILTGVVSNKGSAGGYYTVNLEGNFYTIDLSFNNSDEFDDVSIGDTITIRGYVEGLNIIYITISNCSIE